MRMRRALLVAAMLASSAPVGAADVPAPTGAQKPAQSADRSRADAEGRWIGRDRQRAGSGRGSCDGTVRRARLRNGTGPGRQSGPGGGRR